MAVAEAGIPRPTHALRADSFAIRSPIIPAKTAVVTNRHDTPINVQKNLLRKPQTLLSTGGNSFKVEHPSVDRREEPKDPSRTETSFPIYPPIRKYSFSSGTKTSGGELSGHSKSATCRPSLSG
jgi:hypothetical protein